MHTFGQIQIMGSTGIRKGMAETITMQGLTDKQREYCRLVAITNFHQLSRMAVYMNEGLSFDDSVRKYLSQTKKAQTNA